MQQPIGSRRAITGAVGEHRDAQVGPRVLLVVKLYCSGWCGMRQAAELAPLRRYCSVFKCARFVNACRAWDRKSEGDTGAPLYRRIRSKELAEIACACIDLRPRAHLGARGSAVTTKSSADRSDNVCCQAGLSCVTLGWW